MVYSSPFLNQTDYYNCKQAFYHNPNHHRPQISLSGNINVGWPGSIHDALVFVNSILHEMDTIKSIV